MSTENRIHKKRPLDEVEERDDEKVDGEPSLKRVCLDAPEGLVVEESSAPMAFPQAGMYPVLQHITNIRIAAIEELIERDVVYFTQYETHGCRALASHPVLFAESGFILLPTTKPGILVLCKEEYEGKKRFITELREVEIGPRHVVVHAHTRICDSAVFFVLVVGRPDSRGYKCCYGPLKTMTGLCEPTNAEMTQVDRLSVHLFQTPESK